MCAKTFYLEERGRTQWPVWSVTGLMRNTSPLRTALGSWVVVVWIRMTRTFSFGGSPRSALRNKKQTSLYKLGTTDQLHCALDMQCTLWMGWIVLAVVWVEHMACWSASWFDSSLWILFYWTEAPVLCRPPESQSSVRMYSPFLERFTHNYIQN